MTKRPFRRSILARVLACGVLLLASRAAFAQTDQIYFPAVDNVTNALVSKINAETVRIDMSAWYLTEHSVSIAVLNAFKRGVQIRLIGDRGAIFEIDAKTRNEFYWLAWYGVPIRLRYNPTWFPEIDHWKTTIFKGQKLVAFGSANYTPNQLAPASSTDYSDETVLFSTDSTLVGAFLTKFDQIWNDTTIETESIISGPPYFKNWNDACSAEVSVSGGCADYLNGSWAASVRSSWDTSLPQNPVTMNVNTARLEGNNSMPADLIWGQGPDFNTRVVQEINNESSAIKFVIYRLTVDNVTNALLTKFQSGVPVQLIIEPAEYLNRKWPEFWLTHANLDKLWAAGIPIRQRQHNGLTHMKMLVTSNYATNASSNFAAHWQRDQDYFVSASGKPTIYQAMLNRFNTMWGDTTGFTTFVPQPPDAPTLASPSSGSTGVSQTPTLTWNRAVFATSYDVYLGTSSSSLSFVGNVPAQMTDNPPNTYSWTASSSLAGGTTYYWKVVARTNATVKNSSLVASSSTWSFVTGGSGGGTPPPSSSLPSPWADVDLGSVGAAGSATYSSGTFTVKGSGGDIWGTADAFNFVYQPLAGDGQIIARVASVGNTNTYAKAGVMLREQLTAGSSDVILDVRPGGSIEFMDRTSSGGSTNYLAGATQAPPAWLKLARSGSTITASVSSNGSTWSTVGTASVSMASSIYVGLAVCSHVAGTLMTATFDNVSVSTSSAPPPPPPSTASNVVVYAGDVPLSSVHGSWAQQADGSAAGGIKLATPDNGYAQTNNALASPTHYVDVTFNAQAGTPYRIWLRLQALNNSKYNDSVWVQFSDAQVNGASAYPIGTTSGLLVNLATDSTGSSLSGWGWQNTAYWLSQATTVTFPTTGSHTLRIQVREDGVQFDQIVLSPSQYLSSAPGGVSNDSTIVPK